MSPRKCFILPVAALALAHSTLLTPPAARAQANPNVKITVLAPVDSANTLTVGPDGSLFGTTGSYPGTIFKVTLGGVYHKLIAFNTTNGLYPANGPLLALPDGSLFGSTLNGGKSNTGVLFRFTPKRRFQIKHEFASVNKSFVNVRGAYPVQPMASGPGGAVYGVTARGGSRGGGVVFRYTETRGMEVLHEFEDGVRTGFGGVSIGPDGAIYGTTFNGGASGLGQVFRITAEGTFSVLHSFVGADGENPTGAPVTGPDGALYGTTYHGGGDVGDSNGGGTAYRVTTDGTFTTLVSFYRDSSAYLPVSSLVVGPDGNFYGKTQFSREANGAVFKITPEGKLTVLLSGASGDPDIGTAYTGVVFGHDNALYVPAPFAIYKLTFPF